MNRHAAVERVHQAALEVLAANSTGPVEGLPRTAGWGYPEPYTRDWCISGLGILASGDAGLIQVVRRVLLALAENQSPLGQIPSLANDPGDLGASDTTPLFMILAAVYRQASGEKDLFKEALARTRQWMRYQQPDENHLVAQQPTSDWRDEQWVPGYGLFVNVLHYTALRLLGDSAEADSVQGAVDRTDRRTHSAGRRVDEGLGIPGQPYYALWAYKVTNSKRFDLLGNCLAILSGLADQPRANEILDWIDIACRQERAAGKLKGPLPPCLMPSIQPGDEEWHPRMVKFNQPGRYHNGGVWPFISGIYVAALAHAGRHSQAEEMLQALADLMVPAVRPGLEFGFNEWFDAQEYRPRGQDWQTWSAAMYLYAFKSLQLGRAPFLDGRGLDDTSAGTP